MSACLPCELESADVVNVIFRNDIGRAMWRTATTFPNGSFHRSQLQFAPATTERAAV